MLSISALRNSSRTAHYFTRAAGREDYYEAGGEPPGYWSGAGAAALGLEGHLREGDLAQILEGYHPRTGAALAPNAGEGHKPGWDATFSAPKSVSIAWAVADPETRHSIQAAHSRAVAAGLRVIEEHATYARRGHAGAERIGHEGLIAAVYEHSTSRNQDPQLHSHAIIMNVARGEDGKWSGIDLDTRWKMAAGAVYRAELATELQRLGFATERTNDRGEFEILGIKPEVLEHFSSRRAEIEEHLRAHGQEGALASQVATLATRAEKEIVSRPALFARWGAEAAARGFTREEVRMMADGRAQPLPAPSVQAIQAGLTAQHSTYTDRDLLTRAAQASVGALDARGIQALTARVRRDQNTVELADRGGPRYTTREMRALEERLVARGEAMAARGQGLAKDQVERTLAAHPRLSAEQQQMVRHVCGGGDLTLVQGGAGTGKSTALGAAREAWEDAGWRVVGAALSGKAAEGLESGSGIRSQTIHSLLGEIDQHPAREKQWTQRRDEVLDRIGEARDHIGLPVSAGQRLARDRIDAAAAGALERLDEARPRAPLDARTVLVIDEAGMVGSRQMGRLLEAADQAGARVVLVGDRAQLQAIDAGAPFRALQQKTGYAELSEIHRQADRADRQAVRALRAGRADEALENLSRRGRVHQHESPSAAHEAVGRAVVEDLRAGKTSIAITSTRAEARAVNSAAREAAVASGLVARDGMRVETHGGAREFAQGDRIVFLRNSREERVKNGDFGTVIEARGADLKIKLDRGGERQIDPQKYPHLDHGYSATCHKLQGATVARAHVLAGEAMGSREWAYVAGSRHRERVDVHVASAEKKQEKSAEKKIDDLALAQVAKKWSKENQKETSLDYDRRRDR